MTMTCWFLDKDKKPHAKSKNIPCFMQVRAEPESKYFVFELPKAKGKENNILLNQYLWSIADLFDFGKWITKRTLSISRHTITFNLAKIPAHKIFAICTCIRVASEEEKSVFFLWKRLNDSSLWNRPLTSMEKFVLMHYLGYHQTNSNHSLYPDGINKNFDKFISYAPIYFPRRAAYDFSGEGKQIPLSEKDATAPFLQNPNFIYVSLFCSYSNKKWRDGKGDGSFEAFLKAHVKDKSTLQKFVNWNRYLPRDLLL